ncbi:MAG: sigma-70 family RNA polymerase sigma factor [Deinococcales bacterium]
MEIALTDNELIGAMANSDEQALIELHRRYAPYLRAMARKMLRDRDDVDQCIQDAFVKAWDAAGSFDATKASAKTWLVTIAHRTVLNKIRGGRLETVPLELWDSPLNPPNHVTRIVLEEAVARLEPYEKELIELAFYQGYSHSQIAQELSQPLGTIKSRIRQALDKLRSFLEDPKGGDDRDN